MVFFSLSGKEYKGSSHVSVKLGGCDWHADLCSSCFMQTAWGEIFELSSKIREIS